jgi:hypothetical protein
VVRIAIAALLLLAACSTSAVTGRPRGFVTGLVYSAPTCPVERAGHPCPPARVRGAVVVARSRGREVATTRTDGAGRFTIYLRPGRYRVVATNIGGYVSRAARTVTVNTTRVTITLTVDSGIR